MGEIMLVSLSSDSLSMFDLRSITDKQVRQRLLSVSGVAQVVVIGGKSKQFQILALCELSSLLLCDCLCPDAKPELRLRLAQWYIEAEDWRAVTRMLAPLDDDIYTYATSQARLLLGIAQFELGNTNAARSAFQRAREFPKTSQTAQQWLDFIDTLPAEKT